MLKYFFKILYLRAIGGVCDRCGCILKDFIKPSKLCGFTMGYYDTRSGPWWKLARVGEEWVCDTCMWSDPGYREIYGINPGVSGSHVSRP